jgi:hypothetical protein
MANDRNIPKANDAYKIITYASAKRIKLFIRVTTQINK